MADKTGTLPGLDHKKNKAVQEAAETHQAAKEAFALASERAKKTKATLIGRMLKWGRENPDYTEKVPEKNLTITRHQLPDGEVVEATEKIVHDVKIKAAKQEEE